MATSIDNSRTFLPATGSPQRLARVRGSAVGKMGVTAPAAGSPQIARVIESPVKLQSGNVVALQERRRRRRVPVQPMYTSALVRVLSQRGTTLEGHVLDVSENGMAVQIDSLIPLGQSVTVEFRVSGLGRVADGQWTEHVAAAEVVRHDDLDDFPRAHTKWRCGL